MLYLEDYMEMMETLPQELRDRFTEIRELDLKVQNSTDRSQSRIKMFFANARKMKPAERQQEYDAIQQEYHKSLEDADDKVNISSHMYDLVDKYIRRLDQELHKFKMELEADNAGITEILERRSLELDTPLTANNTVKEVSNRTIRHSTEKRQTSSNVDKKDKPTAEARLPVLTDAASAGYMGYMGVGGNALAAAASQAITATQQMQQGRRTASLKASYEAVNAGVYSQDFGLTREFAGVSSRPSTPVGAVSGAGPPEKKLKKLKCLVPPPASPALSEELVGDTIIDTNLDNQDWSYDPNEPRYCVCNQVSYGDMVACDNAECVLEWFHYSCVGITQPPKGKWFCPQCTVSTQATDRHKKRSTRR